jgi:hypothetical protein
MKNFKFKTFLVGLLSYTNSMLPMLQTKPQTKIHIHDHNEAYILFVNIKDFKNESILLEKYLKNTHKDWVITMNEKKEKNENLIYETKEFLNSHSKKNLHNPIASNRIIDIINLSEKDMKLTRVNNNNKQVEIANIPENNLVVIDEEIYEENAKKIIETLEMKTNISENFYRDIIRLIISDYIENDHEHKNSTSNKIYTLTILNEKIDQEESSEFTLFSSKDKLYLQDNTLSIKKFNEGKYSEFSQDVKIKVFYKSISK